MRADTEDAALAVLASTRRLVAALRMEEQPTPITTRQGARHQWELAHAIGGAAAWRQHLRAMRREGNQLQLDVAKVAPKYPGALR